MRLGDFLLALERRFPEALEVEVEAEAAASFWATRSLTQPVLWLRPFRLSDWNTLRMEEAWRWWWCLPPREEHVEEAEECEAPALPGLCVPESAALVSLPLLPLPLPPLPCPPPPPLPPPLCAPCPWLELLQLTERVDDADDEWLQVLSDAWLFLLRWLWRPRLGPPSDVDDAHESVEEEREHVSASWALRLCRR